MARRFLPPILSRHPGTPGRSAFLSSGETRLWTVRVMEARVIRRLAREASAADRSRRARRAEPATARWGSAKTGESLVFRLMDAVADAGVLARTAPEGTLPADFPRRALGWARGRLIALDRDLPRIAIPFLPPEARRGSVRLLFHEDPESGRSARELPFPGTGCVLTSEAKSGGSIVIRLAEATLGLGSLTIPYPAQDPAALPAGWVSVGARVHSGARALTVGERDPGFERRVRGALDLLGRISPEARSSVLARTWLVVPVVEPGTVSWSGPAVPGVSFINVRSRPQIRVAEDLLHEATHQRLHEIESHTPLVRARAGGDGAAVERFYSPWRGEMRPLRGIVHASCTFTVGAWFFERALRYAEGSGRADRSLGHARSLWLARRLVEEWASTGSSVNVLRSAGKRGLLTRQGTRLLGAVEAMRRRLADAARSRRRWLKSEDGGRPHLQALERHAERLASGPSRWSWDSE